MESHIAPEVLAIKIYTVDDEVLTLKELICQTTPEDIVKANYIVGEDSLTGELYLSSFNAWTESYVLTLVQMVHGAYMICQERNFD